MKKLMISAAALALLAAPAFAQGGDEHRDRGGNGGEQRQGGGQQGGGQQGGGHRENGGGNGAAMQHTAPAAQPAPQAVAPQAAPQANTTMMRHEGGTGHRENNYNNNGNNNANNAMHGPNNGMASPNNGMRGPNNAMRQGMRQDRPHVTNFNSYHRNYTAPQHFRVPAYRRPQGWYNHRWTFGERLPAAFFVRDFWIDDYFDYGLTVPPYGTEWVRYGNDAVLVDEASGQIIQVVYNLYY